MGNFLEADTLHLDVLLHTSPNNETIELAINALRLATEVIDSFVGVCDESQISQVAGVRFWQELYSVNTERNNHE